MRGLFETASGEASPVPNLKIRAEVQLPLEADLPQSPFQLKFVAEVGEGGEIREIRLVSKPPVGPIPLKPWLKFFTGIPIVGPWVSVRGKAVEMVDEDKKILPLWLQVVSALPLAGLLVESYREKLEQETPDRAVFVTANYLFFDLTVEGGKMVFDAGGITKRDFEKRGLPVYRVPEHLHQLVGMILGGSEKENPPNPPLSKGGKGGFQSSAHVPAKTEKKLNSEFLGTIPRWQQATIEITGDFSNRTIEVDLETDLQKRMDPKKVRKLRLEFTGKVPPGGHRIAIRGGLFSPTVEIAGLKTIEYVHPERLIRASNTARTPTPLKVAVSLNPRNTRELAAAFSWNHNDGLKLEEISRSNGKVLSKLELPQGGEVKNFTVRLDGLTPDVSIEQLRTGELKYDGHGVSLHTVAKRRQFEGDHKWLNEIPEGAGLADVHFQVVNGRPRFEGIITSQMDGVVSYHFPDGAIQGLGQIKFRPLAGIAPLSIGSDEKNPNHTRISISNAKLHADLPTLGLRVSNRSREGIFSTRVAEADLDVEGSVQIVPQRREVEILAEHPGGAVFSTHQAFVRWNDLRLNITNARFMGHRLKIQPAEDGSLELMEAFFDHMSLSGELTGQAAISLSDPPVKIPFRVRKKMPIQMTVESVEDRAPSEAGGVVVERIFIDAEESEPTLLPREAAACGFDRQRLRLRLEAIEVQPDATPQLRIRNIGDDLKINLIEELTGSCLSVGMGKAP
ncbi:MAG: hypothetical protein HYT76_00565 [Deltaproteobacteria bacterium]|nr:hypothetical protein [Deltaproteobacteria bacterium]